MEIDLKLGLPDHVAIIMDGNGRWAKRQFMPRIIGHRKGAERVREVVNAAGELGIKALTLYAFSEENWGRPRDEVDGLMQLLEAYLEREIHRLNDKNVQLRIIGDRSRLPARTQALVEEGETLMFHNQGLKLIIALSYGGRSEIVDACRRLAEQVAAGLIRVEDIDQGLFSQHLQTSDLPDPDLLIRTSGEQRISNFLLWQMAYTEFVFTPVLWPEFSKQHFYDAIKAFQRRCRRFGGVAPEQKFVPAAALGGTV